MKSAKILNSVKNCSIVPQIELHLHIIMINLYTKFHFSKCKHCEQNYRLLELQHWKSKGHHYLIIPKFELDIYIIYCYDKTMNFIPVLATSMKKIQGILVDRPTGRQNSIKAIFFEGGHNNYICI